MKKTGRTKLRLDIFRYDLFIYRPQSSYHSAVTPDPDPLTLLSLCATTGVLQSACNAKTESNLAQSLQPCYLVTWVHAPNKWYLTMSAYLISSTNSPTFPKNHECKAIKPNFTNITDCLRSKAKNSNNNKNLYRKQGKCLEVCLQSMIWGN